MSPWQLLNQLAYTLRSKTWTDSPNEYVLASTHASAGVAKDAANELKLPYALIRPLGSTSDLHSPALKTQTLEVIIAIAHAGDRLGEFALLGGQRPAVTPSGGSKGRGLLEIEEEVLGAINYVGQQHGVRIHAVNSSAAEAAEWNGAYLVARSYEMQAIVTTARIYPAPSRLAATAAGSGVVNLTWTSPPYRFDHHPATSLPSPWASIKGQLVLRRAAGATAPTTVTGGTGVTLAALHESAQSDSPGVGQWSYSLWAQYDDYGTSAYNTSTSSTVTITAT